MDQKDVAIGSKIKVGDKIDVGIKIKEGDKERTQSYKGLVIAINGKGDSKTVTVRKISYGIGVEKIFPFNSPKVNYMKVISRGKVRRSKIYYMRDRIGKKAMKIKNEIKVRNA